MNDQLEIVSQPAGKQPATQNFRVVLRHVGGYTPYVTHLENLTDAGEPKSNRDFYYGHYCETLEQGMESFKDRCKTYKLRAA